MCESLLYAKGRGIQPRRHLESQKFRRSTLQEGIKIVDHGQCEGGALYNRVGSDYEDL